jgi:predicted nucleotidyltransferase
VVNNQLIEEITRILKEEGAQKVILFGSYASGNPEEESDLDLLVITPGDFIPASNREKMDLHHQFNSKIKSFRSFIPIDLLVYTRAMFEKAMDSPNLFFREIQTKGKVLYEAVN